MTTRGTSNTNVRGSAKDRRARRQWILSAYGDGFTCPCWDCDAPLDAETLTIARATPGALGGTYRRENCRPSCATCLGWSSHPIKEKKRIAEGRRAGHPPNCGHCRNVREYRLARHAAELERERVTAAYPAELADYGPILTFRDWLVMGRGRNEAAA